MSLGSFLRKIGKNKIVRGIGRAVDFGSDFLPPGFRDVGNFGGKILQGQNLKTAALGTGTDYLGGRAAKLIAGKLPGGIKNIVGGGGGAGGIPAFPGSGMPAPDLSAVPGAVADIGNKTAQSLGGTTQNLLTRGLDYGKGAAANVLASRVGLGTGVGAPSSSVSANGNGTPGGGAAAGAPSGNWLTGLLKTPGVAEGLIGLGGSALQGYGQGKIAEADRKWETSKFGMENAPGVQRQIEMSPMRDRAMYMLSQRMGAPMQTFSPRDIFNPGGAGTQGGYDQNALNAANARYKPGAGGVDPSVLQAILKKMGYGQPTQAVR